MLPHGFSPVRMMLTATVLTLASLSPARAETIQSSVGASATPATIPLVSSTQSELYYWNKYFDTVNSMYQSLLGYPVHRGSLQRWAALLENGYSSDKVRQYILASEGRSAVARNYREIMGIEADSRTLDLYTQRLVQGWRMAQVREDLFRKVGPRTVTTTGVLFNQTTYRVSNYRSNSYSNLGDSYKPQQSRQPVTTVQNPRSQSPVVTVSNRNYSNNQYRPHRHHHDDRICTVTTVPQIVNSNLIRITINNSCADQRR